MKQPWKKTPNGGCFWESNLILVEVVRGLGSRHWSWTVVLNGKHGKTTILLPVSRGFCKTLGAAKTAACASVRRMLRDELKVFSGMA